LIDVWLILRGSSGKGTFKSAQCKQQDNRFVRGHKKTVEVLKNNLGGISLLCGL
tara:strand:+ start:133 stop:294 length:162 start_codon:yes stop_codon:yes gene_type:complete